MKWITARLFRYFLVGFLFFLLILKVNKGLSQTIDSAYNNPSYFYTGGNFGLMLGTYSYIEFAPIIGYAFNEDFNIGVGMMYQYLNVKDKAFQYKHNLLGANVFVRYFVKEAIFVYGEYAIANLKKNDYWRIGVDNNVLIENVNIGGGYRTELADNIFANFLLLYNLNESVYYPVQNPIIRVGFEIMLY